MDVINHLKSAFAQHGIPQILRSYNGPQFSASQFRDFTKSFNINHITSSPRFAQSNGEVERSFQTVKNLLKKSGDPYLALLAYQTTPLVNGEAPCQLLMGRMLRTTIPVHPSCLIPKYKIPDKVFRKEEDTREKEKYYYDRRHSARHLRDLEPGKTVYVPDLGKEAKVQEQESTKQRSYNLLTPKGKVQRNRQHIRPIPEDSTGQEMISPIKLSPKKLSEPEIVPPQSFTVEQGSTSSTTKKFTHSGRQVKVPARFRDEM